MNARKKPSHRKNHHYIVRKKTFVEQLIAFFVAIFASIGRPFYYAITFTALYVIVLLGIGVPNFFVGVARSIRGLFIKTKKPRPSVPVSTRIGRVFSPLFSPIAVLVHATPPLFYVTVSIIFTLTFSSTFFYFYIVKDLPSPRDLINHTPIVSTKIYDRNNLLLYEIYKDERRTLVPLSSIPDNLKNATIAIEDKDFYTHNGISIRGILRSFVADLQQKRIEGGSTITQQLIKNTLLTPERTLRRKIREVILAMLVESSLSKDEILQMYFNEVSYGGSVYGAEEASRRFFGKSVQNLSLAESAYLAGLPQAPSTYSPFGPNPDLGLERQHQVLQQMVENKMLSMQDAETAREEKLNFQPDINNIKAPHFVMYIKDLLAKQYGEDVVNQGGLEVHTTLDYGIQQAAEAAVDKEMANVKRFHITNGAAMVTDPKNGAVLAMVGSQNYFDTKNDGQVNVALRPRQPGSSIKPLTYATAFEHGLTPSSLIEDAPVTFNSLGSPPYSPKNYDGRFHGTVTVRTALASSYNIPAVKTLASVGVSAVVQKGRQLGITTWDDAAASRFGLSLTLGGGEIEMIDMTQLYGTFANTGVTVPINPFLQVKNYKGEVLYTNTCQDDTQLCSSGTKVLDPRIAFQITNILDDNLARAPAFGLNSVLNIPNQQVAVKTGTTNNLHDNWTFGYTSNRLVATWVGNNDNSAMSYVASGITGASPIWNTIMTGLLDPAHPNAFAQPADLVKVRICASTGTLPCAACPVQRDEMFLPGTEPKTACHDEAFASPNPDGSQPIPTPLIIRDNILNGASTIRH
ncbi:MAG TPA: PBP1A family penicillin-binding protein [Candidatus Saccharimonadia bacterium]|nr:PBP1A family penicillin-binding protein [Candidatus Saccharimonadia bacterium]